MRIRWLFILLGTIQIHLGGSELLVDEDGDRMDTFSSNLTLDNDLFGEWTINGNESTSETKKIRRTRASTADLEKQLEIAEEKLKSLENETTRANQLDDIANTTLYQIKEELRIAKQESEKIQKVFNDSENMLKKADDLLETANNYVAGNLTKKNEAEIAYNRTKKKYEDLMAKTTPLKKDLEQKTIVFNESYNAWIAANTEKNTREQKMNDSINQLGVLEHTRNLNNGTLSLSMADLEKKQKIIEKDDAYQELKAYSLQLGNNKSILDKIYDDSTGAVTKLTNDLTSINKNVLMKQVNPNAIFDLPLDQAVLKYSEMFNDLAKQLQDLSANATNATKSDLTKRKGHARTSEINLKGIRSLEYWKIVNIDIGNQKAIDIITNASEIKKDIGRLIDMEDAKAKKANNDRSLITGQLADIKNQMEALTSDPTALASQAETDRKTLKEAKEKVKTDNATFFASDEAVTNKTLEIGQLTNLFNAANDKLQKIESNKTTLEKKKIISYNTWSYADGNATEFKNNELKQAENLKIETKHNFDTAEDEKNEIYFHFVEAETTAKNRTSERDKALAKVNTIEKERLIEAINNKSTSATNALKAFKAVEAKKKEIEKLKDDLKVSKGNDKMKEAEAEAKKRKDEAAEADKQKTVRALSTGLGVAGGILVLMIIAGVIAFVLIRRKKNAKPKKPKREELDADNGLTIIRREGQPDKYVVKGEDFKIMGPLVRARVHNDALPLKHQLDGQEGGDKIEKLYFDKSLNQAYFIGEGVEIVEDDSVSVSENLDAKEYLTDEPCDKYQKEEDPPKAAPKSDGKKSAPSSEDKKVAPKSDEKKSSKSKRSNDPNPKKTSSSPRPEKK